MAEAEAPKARVFSEEARGVSMVQRLFRAPTRTKETPASADAMKNGLSNENT